MVDIYKYSNDLVEKDGIFLSQKESEISYPKEGHSICLQLEENSFWFSHRNNCIVEVVKKYSQELPFFDVGGGNGFVAKALENEGVKTVLVEPGIQGCLNAQKRNVPVIVCSSIEDAGFKPDSIPSIGLFDVVEHIKNDIAFLKSIHSGLMQNGYVYITVPAYNFLWSTEDDFGGHFRRYTKTDLESKLKNAGFEIVYSTYIFSFLPLPVFLFRTLPSFLGVKRKTEKVARHKEEHSNKSTLLDRVLQLEVSWIKKGRSIPFGGSCFVVARK